MENLKGTKIAPMILEGLSPAWTDEDTSGFVSAMSRHDEISQLRHEDQIQIFSYFKKALTIRQYKYEEAYRNRAIKFFVGSKVVCRYHDYVAPHATDLDSRMGLDEYERVRELERLDPLNDQGLLRHFMPGRVKVPRVTVTRLQGKQNTLNKVLMRAELPSELTKCEILTNDEHNMVFSGRDKGSEPASERQEEEPKAAPSS